MDAALNNYVALHYASRHMSWLHCMWGVGASTGPYVMEYALMSGKGWNMGYRYISMLQIGLTIILFLALPLWKNQNVAVSDSKSAEAGRPSSDKVLSLAEILRISGAKEVMSAFFCYCALESTAGLWASSYLVLHRGISAETAAGFAALFYVGITVGRALSGFLTLKCNDTQMIRLGEGVILFGVVLLLLPFGEKIVLAGLLSIGLGCAPIYPSIIHSTPAHFGADKSQALIGVQMAAAYVGICLMPPIFGFLANHVGVFLLPFYLLAILFIMFMMYERLLRI